MVGTRDGKEKGVQRASDVEVEVDVGVDVAFQAWACLLQR